MKLSLDAISSIGGKKAPEAKGRRLKMAVPNLVPLAVYFHQQC